MKRVLPLLFLFVLLLTGCYDEEAAVPAVSLDELPAYAGEPYVAVNANQPFFEETDYTTEAFETYSELDDLGRCGPAYACVGTELMPTEDRESISSVTPHRRERQRAQPDHRHPVHERGRHAAL